MTTIRMLIALASVHGLIIHQMDVKTTFLHGDLEEEIYMDQPEGFVASSNERKTSNILVNESDKCVYYKVRGNDCVIVCLYVDDILLFGTNIDIINETKSFLKMHFEMKDMGEASVILGIKLTQSTDGITLSQSHYIEKSILEKYGYSNCRIASTPYDSKVALVKNSSGVHMSQLRYTRCPNKTHWEALDRVLRYLKATISLGLHYRRFSGVLEGYSDASWIVSKPLPAISVHSDSRTTIDKVKSVKYNVKTKRHIQVRLKSIRGLVSDRIIAIEFIETQDNIADPLTKGIEHAIVLKSRLGMRLANRGLGLTTHIIDHYKLVLKFPEGTNSTWCRKTEDLGSLHILLITANLSSSSLKALTAPGIGLFYKYGPDLWSDQIGGHVRPMCALDPVFRAELCALLEICLHSFPVKKETGGSEDLQTSVRASCKINRMGFAIVPAATVAPLQAIPLPGVRPPIQGPQPADSDFTGHSFAAHLTQQQQRQINPQVTFKTFQEVNLPEFKGSLDPIDARVWLKEIEKAFALVKVKEEQKTEFASYYLKNEVTYWWETVKTLKVADYESKFEELSRFVPSYVDTDRKKAKRFQQGLTSWIRAKVAIFELDTYAGVV
ncbi:hypothetical protein AgCh_009856 [Apium graveolens]